MKGMCAVCGNPATSPYVDRRFCHLCGMAFAMGLLEASQGLTRLPTEQEPSRVDP